MEDYIQMGARWPPVLLGRGSVSLSVTLLMDIPLFGLFDDGGGRCCLA